jgi:hypothetical protein
MSKKKPKKRNKKYTGSANKEIKNNPSPFFNKHAVVGKVSSSKASQMGRRRKV